MGGKTKTSSNTTQTMNAYAPAKPYIDSGVQGLGGWMTGPGATAYTGPRVADFSGSTRAGVDNLNRSAGAKAAYDYYDQTLGGRWLNQDNPYLQRVQDAVKASVMPTLNSQFSGAGLTGSTLHQGTVGRELGRAMAQPLFAAYENERNRMDAAAGNIGNADNMISNNYLTAGQVLDSHAQNVLNANKQAFEDQRLAPVRAFSKPCRRYPASGRRMERKRASREARAKFRSDSRSWAVP